MKKSIYLIGILAVTSCGKDLSKPEDVAMNALKAAYSLNLEEAKNYCTETTKDVMDNHVALFLQAMSQDEEMINAIKKTEVISCECKGDDTKKTCDVLIKEGKVTSTRTLFLVRSGKSWLVEMNQEQVLSKSVEDEDEDIEQGLDTLDNSADTSALKKLKNTKNLLEKEGEFK